jgi:porphobilinogen deaminase
VAKLDAGDYDAIVLACAGLQRLGLGARITRRLVAPDWLPAPAQAALAVDAATATRPCGPCWRRSITRRRAAAPRPSGR